MAHSRHGDQAHCNGTAHSTYHGQAHSHGTAPSRHGADLVAHLLSSWLLSSSRSPQRTVGSSCCVACALAHCASPWVRLWCSFSRGTLAYSSCTIDHRRLGGVMECAPLSPGASAACRGQELRRELENDPSRHHGQHDPLTLWSNVQRSVSSHEFTLGTTP
jgi:hypothetical protein